MADYTNCFAPANFLNGRKTTRCIVAPVLAASLWFPLGATADWHGSLTFLSDYQHRGYTKSRSNPVIQGKLDYEHQAGWYVGAILSQVSFDDKPSKDRAFMEARPYAGWSRALNDSLRADLSATGYIFNGKVFGQNANYVEIGTSLTYENWLTGRVSVAPNAYNTGVDVLNYEAQVRHDLWDNVLVSGGLGFYQAQKLLERDYFYWNAGVTWYPTHYLSFDIRYVDAALNAYSQSDREHFHVTEFYPRPLQNKWILSVSLGF
jgi:uncharacterized protein (TIGR02001 family)